VASGIGTVSSAVSRRPVDLRAFGWLLGRLGLGVWLAISYCYILFVVVFVIAISFMADPTEIPSTFTLHWYADAFAWDGFLLSFSVSVLIGIFVTIIACIVGACAALAVVRYRFPGRQILAAVFMAPLALPQIILAIGLVILFTRLATVTGFRLTATLLGLVISHVVVATPWTIRTVSSVLATMDIHLEEAAQSLGASPRQAFLLVTLPVIYRGMVAGAIFAFITSFGALDLSIMVYPPSLQPLPVMLYNEVLSTPDYRIPAVSVITMIIVGGGIVLADRIAGLDKAL
jgi:putative spermidine/putrescine transport system permease protein